LEQSCLYLHFKGPLSQAELSLFCKYMPFHAASILESATLVRGTFDRRRLLNGRGIDASELKLWIGSLIARSQRYSEPDEQLRCIRKLVLLYAVYARWKVPAALDVLSGIQRSNGYASVSGQAEHDVERLRQQLRTLSAKCALLTGLTP